MSSAYRDGIEAAARAIEKSTMLSSAAALANTIRALPDPPVSVPAHSGEPVAGEAGQPVIIDYTNYRGERSLRRILPGSKFGWGSNEYHPEPQWLMTGYDLEKKAWRIFALRDIHSWTPAPKEDQQ